MDYAEAKAILRENGQDHLLRFWGTLTEQQQNGLLTQIALLDFAGIRRMQSLLGTGGDAPSAQAVAPACVLELPPVERGKAYVAGEEALAAGKVGVLLVAGGQGSRLGFDGPKGCYPVSPVSNATLFEIHAKKIRALERKYRAQVPFYIMTSRANDGETREFFRAHGFFGLDSERVAFFTQQMWPALSGDGKVMLERPDRIFMSPDGHGGVLAALRAGGMLADMARRGLETVFYFQVDNPLVDIADPVFIGAHRAGGMDISLKVCAKRDPEEGLGVVVEQNGRNALLEYTELSEEQKHARLADGALRFRFGSVAIHVFSVSFLAAMAEADLPLHVAHKKVPYCDDTGRTVVPDAPNAHKFEKFIFDVVPHADRALNLAFDRADEFSPVKNASGNDSPETARRDMCRKFTRWLTACGVDVPRDADGDPLYPIEIDPCFALSADELKGKIPAGFRVTGNTLLV